MSVSRWEPFRELSMLEDRVRRMLGEAAMRGGEAESSERRWSPPVDVAETDREFVIRFDVPGVPEDDIRIEIEDGTLVVSGERSAWREDQGERYYRRERSSGSFARSIPLPHGIDEAQIRASYVDGVLDVRIPKPEEPQPKRIKIGS